MARFNRFAAFACGDTKAKRKERVTIEFRKPPKGATGKARVVG